MFLFSDILSWFLIEESVQTKKSNKTGGFMLALNLYYCSVLIIEAIQYQIRFRSSRLVFWVYPKLTEIKSAL